MQAKDKRMQRLMDSGENASSLEARARAFLCEARPTMGLTDMEICAMARRLWHQGGVRRCVSLLPALFALGGVFAGGSVMAFVGGWRSRPPFLDRTPEASPPLCPAKAESTVKVAEGAGNAPLVVANPLSPAMVPAPTLEARPRVVVRRSPRQEPAALPSSTLAQRASDECALSTEARSLADALARWRRDGNAEAALALLGAHERRFPRGALSVESKVARAEILLALARRDQALVVLDSLSLASLPRARELQTLRGELRAQAGRCREARVDLSHVLLDSVADDASKRASLALASGCPASTLGRGDTGGPGGSRGMDGGKSDVLASPEAQGLAALCTSTAGQIETGMCCKSSGDFPDSCFPGACGCSPSNSHPVSICACPNHGCFSTKTGCGPRVHRSDQTLPASPSGAP